jgi:pyoverdine/dityrosine biosynthesis protein Dit1
MRMRPAIHKVGEPVRAEIVATEAGEQIARKILNLTFRFRRLASPEDPCAKEPCEHCFAPHLDRVRSFIERGEPVHFILPAFPAKSPNQQKVLGTLPDMAERVALNFLQSFCEQVEHFYAPGARLTICSDGRVFSDLVGVKDEDVTSYKRELAAMVAEIGGTEIDLYDLDDVFTDTSFDEMRQQLSGQYATPLEQLREQLLSDPAGQGLFNGLHRFLFEDQVVLRPQESRNKVRDSTKELAYKVIQRSNAWSQLIAGRFPQAIRLSIHPQPCHSSKIGMHMLRTRDSWITPWHGVVVDTGEELILVKRSEAERMEASLVWRRSRPSHFVIPASSLERAQ